MFSIYINKVNPFSRNILLSFILVLSLKSFFFFFFNYHVRGLESISFVFFFFSLSSLLSVDCIMAPENSQRGQVEPRPLLNNQNNTLFHYLGIVKAKPKIMAKRMLPRC